MNYTNNNVSIWWYCVLSLCEDYNPLRICSDSFYSFKEIWCSTTVLAPNGRPHCSYQQHSEWIKIPLLHLILWCGLSYRALCCLANVFYETLEYARMRLNRNCSVVYFPHLSVCCLYVQKRVWEKERKGEREREKERK